MYYLINGSNENGLNSSWFKDGMIFTVEIDECGYQQQFLTKLKKGNEIQIVNYDSNGADYKMAYFNGVTLINVETNETILVKNTPSKEIEIKKINIEELLELTKDMLHIQSINIILKGGCNENFFNFIVELELCETTIKLFHGNSFRNNDVEVILNDIRNNLKKEIRIIQRFMTN